MTSEYWIIPELIAKEIEKEFKKKGERKTYVSLLETFINSGELEKLDSKVWAIYKTKDFEDPTKLLRALNLVKEYGVNIKDGKEHFLDLLCLFAFKRKWSKILKKYKIPKESIDKRPYYKSFNQNNKAVDVPQLEIIKNIEKVLTNTIVGQNNTVLEILEQINKNIEDWSNSDSRVVGKETPPPLSARDAVEIIKTNLRTYDLFSISQQGFIQSEVFQQIDIDLSLADAKTGKSRIWIVEYIDRDRKLLLTYGIRDGVYKMFPEFPLEEEALILGHSINFLFIDSPVAVQTALDCARKYKFISEMTETDFSVMTRLVYFDEPINNFSWCVMICDKAQAQPICTVHINPINGKIRFPYPVAQGPLTMLQYVSFLADEIGYDTTDPEVVIQIKKDLAESLETRINRMIIDELPEEQYPAFEAILDIGREKEMIEFCKKYIPELDKKITRVCAEFRKQYIRE